MQPMASTNFIFHISLLLQIKNILFSFKIKGLLRTSVVAFGVLLWYLRYFQNCGTLLGDYVLLCKDYMDMCEELYVKINYPLYLSTMA
jgi:hypothetical protein